MKNIYMVGGTMGVGKTTACQILKTKLANCVFLDGDWCWDMNPFQVTPETKKMVMENICFLLNQLIHCSAYDNIVFCWVMHEQSIIDGLLSKLDADECTVHCISLICQEASLRKRLERDVEAGIRSGEIIERSIGRLCLYGGLETEKIDVSGLTPEQTAEEILKNHS
ncbi:MAG TPA: AAA family ATPase [Candidatus Blautia faecipullorum]|nr:AAA family ATPase [Candidatus Blautia faecipullorum]